MSEKLNDAKSDSDEKDTPKGHLCGSPFCRSKSMSTIVLDDVCSTNSND